MKEVNYTALPYGIQRVADPFKMLVKCHECNDIQDMVDQTKKYPLELFLIAQTKEEVVERYFLVGLCIRNKLDNFKNPLLFYSPVPNHQYEALEKAVKLYGHLPKKNPLIWTPGNN